MSYRLRVEPRDPVVARDGRPFGADSGHRMKSMDWLSPSVLAGSVRSLVGTEAGGNFAGLIPSLKQLEVHGPFLVHGEQMFVPAPKDILMHPDGAWYGIRPAELRPEEGWDLGDSAELIPALLDAPEFKPSKASPYFWSLSAASEWLANAQGWDFALAEQESLPALPKDRRTHVRIEATAGAASEGMLFSTEALAFPDGLALEARVTPPPDLEQHVAGLQAIHPLGGERRVAGFYTSPDVAHHCPEHLRSLLVGTTLIRMQLVTPAIFESGWRPRWIEKQLGLSLVSACTDRWRAISGWSYETKGTKPVRRVVPAGSVYFYRAASPLAVDDVWMKPVSDCEQDRRDGFGVAIWGVWTHRETR